MTTTDKVIIGATAVVAISAITMLVISKKYDDASNAVINELYDIHQTLDKSHENILASNKAIAESNRILRKLVIESAEEVTPK